MQISFLLLLFFGGVGGGGGIRRVSLTHSVLVSFFSYTSRAGLFLISGVSLTHPVLAVFFCGEFLLHIPC